MYSQKKVRNTPRILTESAKGENIIKNQIGAATSDARSTVQGMGPRHFKWILSVFLIMFGAFLDVSYMNLYQKSLTIHISAKNIVFLQKYTYNLAYDPITYC